MWVSCRRICSVRVFRSRSKIVLHDRVSRAGDEHRLFDVTPTSR